MKILKKKFGTTPQGEDIKKITIENSHGYSLSLITYGATLTSFKMPDRKGAISEIALGFDTLKEYMGENPYLGATIGRFGNRIGGASFSLDGKQFDLFANDGENHLHGGEKGFNKVIWDYEIFETPDTACVVFSYTSPYGEEGYPGNLDVKASYLLNEENELAIEYFAETDAPTPINLTNHTYWNLAGAGSGTTLNHMLKLDCPKYLPVNSKIIPTGDLTPVKGTPFDFTEAKIICKDFADVDGGYDHCWILPEAEGCNCAKESDDPSEIDLPFRMFAQAWDPTTGRKMEVGTTQPGVQFYTGNFLPDMKGADGASFSKHGGFCLETQNFPDAINKSHFPNCVLKPGEIYKQRSVYKFSIV